MVEFFRGVGRMLRGFDWVLFVSALSISLLGLVTMRPFVGDPSLFFERQIVWIGIGAVVFALACIPSYSILRRTSIVAGLLAVIVSLLTLVFIFGAVVKGAQSRFDLGAFVLQPAELAKLVLIILLAKYFARRHVEIAHIRHILVSGAYAFVLFGLVFFQPDFGSAIIIGAIWFGMVLVAGISWKHLGSLLLIGLITLALLWQYGLADYQKQRILTFLHPLADIQDTGYNAYQSTIAVGAGGISGQGVGQGSQSKLRFLPEYHTGFIFAAYAEEWGFVGVVFLFGLYLILLTRVIVLSAGVSDNFVTLFGAGVAIMFTTHFIVHVGMNIGLLPVTGTTIPLMSYGGSHMLTEFLALGMLVGMSRRARTLVRAREPIGLASAGTASSFPQAFDAMQLFR